MFTTIRDPNMAKGFSVLGSVFGAPDAQTAIKADLQRTQRDRLLAQKALDDQKLLEARNDFANQNLLAGELADPHWADTPGGRARVMSYLPFSKDGLQHGPEFATGAATFTNPQQFNQSDLSNVLIGTGVVKDFASTPKGVADANQRQIDINDADNASLERRNDADNKAKLDEQHIQQDGLNTRQTASLANVLTKADKDNASKEKVAAMKPTGANGRALTPLDVSPSDTSKLWSIAQEQLAATHGSADIAPTLKTAVMARAAELYQQTRNAPLAVQQALKEINVQSESTSSWYNPFSWGDEQLVQSPTAPSAAPAQASPNAAGVAPAPAAPSAPKFAEGQTATGPKGQKIVFRNGQWVPAK